MLVKRYLSPLLGLFLISSPVLQGANIIFDVGNVLVGTNGAAAFWHTGPRHFLWFLCNNPRHVAKAKHHIRYNVLFPFLEKLMPYSPASQALYDETGARLPQVMVEWLCGRLSGESIRALINEALTINPHWCASSAEKDLVRALTSMMFSPITFIQTQKLLPESASFVQHCKEQGHRVFILSNWDATSFELLMERHPEFFSLFDGIVLSGKTGVAKPAPDVYQHLLTTYKLNPSDCFFIDDVQENITAARQLGIASALCTPEKIDSIIPAFKIWTAAQTA